MRRFLTALLFTFLLLTPASAQFGIFYFRDIVNDREYRWFENAFPRIDINEIQIVVMPGDGPGGTVAHVTPDLDSPSRIIFLDWFDWEVVDYFGPGMCQRNKIIAEILIHEMIHVDQTHRGREYRERLFEQFERYEYRDRPFEREAYSVSAILLRYFPFLEGAHE